MLISHKWLQSYFEDPLPSPEKIAEAVTMHAFEIESMEKKDGDTILDVKVLPNRAHDCLSHHGIAHEVGVFFGMKPVGKRFEKYGNSIPDSGIEVLVEDSRLCPRYIGRLIENITMVETPQWLKEHLESLDQRSINIIVDIANYVMFDLGQPMHAFDADKVKGAIQVRLAKEGETITTLDNKDVTLDQNTLVIADDEGPLAIAGIKGGKRAEVDQNTKRIILEAANFSSGNIRKSSQRTGIKTDASKRFENEITPALSRAGIEYATSLIVENVSRDVAVHEIFDVYPRKQNPYKVGVSLSEINRILGIDIKEAAIGDILSRFGWEWELIDPKQRILELAPQLVGKPYKLGASVSYDAPNEFDCSSFTSYLFAQAGIAIPRISVDQFVFGKPVDKKDLEAGDLFFSNTEKGKIYYESVEWLKGASVLEGVDHVGLYIGDRKIIHASRHNEKGVEIEDPASSGQFKNVTGYRRIPGLAEKRFVITVPAVRLDLRIKEDLIEEIGRVYGYDKIPTTLPEKAEKSAHVNKLFYYSQKIRNILTGLGFDEVQTYAFQNEGEVELENPLASDKKFLRSDLKAGLQKALELNIHNAELLGLDTVKIFEIGNVFTKENEEMKLGLAAKNVKKEKTKEDQKIGEALGVVYQELGEKNGHEADIADGFTEISLSGIIGNLPDPETYGNELAIEDNGNKFNKISPYPFVLRDIAVWLPWETPAQELEDVILECSGPLLAKHRQFDAFTKEFDTGEKKTSYAFRMVFQSHEKTLSDDEVNEVMKHLVNKIESNNWQVR